MALTRDLVAEHQPMTAAEMILGADVRYADKPSNWMYGARTGAFWFAACYNWACGRIML